MSVHPETFGVMDLLKVIGVDGLDSSSTRDGKV